MVTALIVAKKNGALGGSKATEVTVEKVGLKTIVESVSASGKIQPEVEVKISPEVSGEIIELVVKEGDSVQEGQLLVRINPDLYEAAVSRTAAAVNSSRAALNQAHAQFEESKKNYSRQQGLYEKGAISSAEFDAAQRAYDVARLQVEAAGFQLKSAEASRKEAQDNLQRTTIYAPADGTISSLKVEKGERVVGTATMAGTELLRLANLNQMEVLVDVNENDIIKVALGDTAIVEVDAYVGRKFKGIVTEVANSAKTAAGGSLDQVTNFEVKVRILKTSYDDLLKKGATPFRPGMTAAVEIQTERQANVVAVPIEAVTTRKDTTGKRSYRKQVAEDEDAEPLEVVFLERDGKAVLQVVTTGIQDDRNIQVLMGLDTGMTIITGPYTKVSRELEAGERVQAAEAMEKGKGK